MKGRVILTHARSLHALAAAHSLAHQGLEVIGCDSVPLTALSFSRNVADTFLHPAVSDVGEDEFVQSVAKECIRYRTDDYPVVLMPMDRNTRVFARCRELFEPWIRVAAPRQRSIECVFPKDRLIATAKAVDSSIPWTEVFHSPAEVDVERFQFPCFVKLSDSHGGIGVKHVPNADELRSTLAEFAGKFDFTERNLLIQGAVDGEDYCLTGIFQDGEFLAHMAYLNLRTFPGDGGFGVKRETVDDGPLVEAAKGLMASTQWTGVAELDYRWDGRADSVPHLIEVNPRFWAGLFQSIASGIDYPWLLYQLTVSGKIPPVEEATAGVRTKIPIVNMFSWVYELVNDDDIYDRIKMAITGRSIASNISDQDSHDESSETERLDNVNRVTSELFSSDDPLASLGVLYVIGSLIRHGKLPEELRRSGER